MVTKTTTMKTTTMKTMGPESLKLSKSMTWLERRKKHATKGTHFAKKILEKCKTFCDIFKKSYLFNFWYNKGHITDNEKLPSSLSIVHCPSIGQLDIHCPTIGQFDIQCQIIGQMDIHRPTIGQLNIHCPTIRHLNINCKVIVQLDIHCPTIGQLYIHCPTIGYFDIYCHTLSYKIGQKMSNHRTVVYIK